MERQSASRSLLTVALLAPLALPGGATAVTWVVPDQLASIQQAVDAAGDRDTVLVHPGTYVETILVAGRPILIRSTEGAETTVIDGSNPIRPDTQSVVCVIGVTGFFLEGFTIRNGSGGSTLGGDSEPSSGGGLSIVGSEAFLSDCLIEGNECDGRGGGIYVHGGAAFMIEGCTITGNRSLTGGGIGVEDSFPTILDCSVRDNRSISGSGIYLLTSSAVIERVLIANNTNDSGAVGFGGGVFAASGSPRIESCTVVGNQNDVGGGIYFWSAPMPTVTRSIVAFNHRGSAMVCRGSTPSLECCDLFGNAAGDELCGIDLGGNLSLDPLLCADYSLAEGSPCLAGQSPGACGLVGAFDMGCASALVPTSWGRIKNGYRAP